MPFYTGHCYGHHFIMLSKSINHIWFIEFNIYGILSLPDAQSYDKMFFSCKGEMGG